MAKQQPVTEAYGITSFVLGIFAILIGWYPVIGWAFVILAIVFGHMQNKHKETSLSRAGLIMGYISLVFSMLGLFFLIVGLFFM